jgi:MGT family glycosyltransferase
MRVLFATTRGAGHVGPMIPLATACRQAGHEVLVAGPEAAATPVLTHAPRSADDPGVPEARGLHRFRVGDPPPARLNGGPRLVYVSFGSEAGTSGHFPRVYRATADALGALPIRVLIAVGERQDPAALGPVPANVRVDRWVDQAEVLSRASAMVGHGGSGSTLAALTAGVPQAFVPLFVDGPRNARRVAELGAGIALGGPDEIGSGLADAVRRLLHDPRPRQAAQAIAAEIRALPPIAEAVKGLTAMA